MRQTAGLNTRTLERTHACTHQVVPGWPSINAVPTRAHACLGKRGLSQELTLASSLARCAINQEVQRHPRLASSRQVLTYVTICFYCEKKSTQVGSRWRHQVSFICATVLNERGLGDLRTPHTPSGSELESKQPSWRARCSKKRGSEAAAGQLPTAFPSALRGALASPEELTPPTLVSSVSQF